MQDGGNENDGKVRERERINGEREEGEEKEERE